MEIKNQMNQNFERLYSQFEQVANDQSKCNQETNEDILKLKMIIKEEIDTIKRENEAILREVRRAERNYEENSKINSMSPDSDRTCVRKLKVWEN